MRLFDLHCDTLYRVLTEKLDINSERLSITPHKADYLEQYNQLMAVWIPDNIRGTAAFDFFRRCADVYISQYKVLNNDNRSFYLTVENGSVLGGNVNNISVLKDYGVKAVTIVYNEDNELGSGALSDSEFGLTVTGKSAVREFENNDIYIDLSHSSVRTFYDVAEISSKPIVATHSNSFSLCKHKRNLTDDQFKVIRESKGIVGVNFYPPFLRDDGKTVGISDVIKHIEYFLSLGGEDTLCIGSDFDGCDPIPELSGIESMPILYENLLKLNYTEQLVQKIFYTNAHNFFA